MSDNPNGVTRRQFVALTSIAAAVALVDLPDALLATLPTGEDLIFALSLGDRVWLKFGANPQPNRYQVESINDDPRWGRRTVGFEWLGGEAAMVQIGEPNGGTVRHERVRVTIMVQRPGDWPDRKAAARV